MTPRSPRVPGSRVVLGLLTGLALLQLALAVSSYWLAARDAQGRFRLPLPARVAAMVDLIEAVPPARYGTVLEAVSSSDFTAAVVAELEDDGDAERYPVAAVARAVERYAGALPDLGGIADAGGDAGRAREIIAWMAPGPDEDAVALTFEATRLWSDVPLRLAVKLADGRWLTIETRDRLAARVFGFPPGLWAGLLGTIVAGLALLALWRAVTPLRALARRVEAFGDRAAVDPRARPLVPAGMREVRQVTRAVNAMQTRIVDLLAERRTMFAAVSHDLRTYLARLSLRIEGIADERSRGKARAELDEMSAMIEDALAFARLGETRPRTAPVDLGVLVGDVAAAHDAPFEARAAVTVVADRLLLRRAIENVVVNAERHAGGGRVRVSSEAGSAVIEVADRGPGIVEPDRLRRPFERGDAERTLDVPGTGLGLAIAERAALAHGGRLEIEARPGGGTLVRLLLPAGA